MHQTLSFRWPTTTQGAKLALHESSLDREVVNPNRC
jgi:hypothetical protein